MRFSAWPTRFPHLCLNGCLVFLKKLVSLQAFADLFWMLENLCWDEAVGITPCGSLTDVLGHLEWAERWKLRLCKWARGVCPPSVECPWFGSIMAVMLTSTVNVLGIRSPIREELAVQHWYYPLKAELIPLHQTYWAHSLKELNLQVHKSPADDGKNTFLCLDFIIYLSSLDYILSESVLY